MADVFTGVIIMLLLATAIGCGLLIMSRRLPQNNESPVDTVNALLPQTQCAQCG